MVDAGWHFAPTKDGPDTCACAYCHLSLDGFELEDNPKYVALLVPLLFSLIHADVMQTRTPATRSRLLFLHLRL